MFLQRILYEEIYGSFKKPGRIGEKALSGALLTGQDTQAGVYSVGAVGGIAMTDKKKMIICFTLILFMNLASNIYFEYTLYGMFSLGWRMIYAIVFYCLQLLLLKYAADSNSKIIYAFPLYWGIEIWRLLFREGIITFLIPGFHIKLWRYSSIFWLSDWFPITYDPHICIYGEKPPYLQIRIETIIKIMISVMAFLFSVYAIIKRRKKNVCKGV